MRQPVSPSHFEAEYTSRRPLSTNLGFLLILAGITLAAILLYWDAYRSHHSPWPEDLAIYNQVLHNMVNHLDFGSEVFPIKNVFAQEHFRLVWFLIAPLYFFYQDAFFLVLLSILTTSLTAFMVVKVSDRFFDRKISFLLFLAFLAYPSTIQCYLFFGGRENVFCMAFLSVSLFFYVEGRFLPWVIFCVLAASCVEYVSPVITGFAIAAAIEGRDKKWIVFSICFGLGYFLLVNGFLMPFLRNGTGFSGVRFAEYAHLGNTPWEVGWTLISEPLKAFDLIFTPGKMKFLAKIFAPLLLLPFLGLEFLLAPLSQFLVILLPETDYYASTYHWHHLPILPFLFVATIKGLKRVADRWPVLMGQSFLMALAILLSTLLVSCVLSKGVSTRLSETFSYFKSSDPPINMYARTISTDASVSAQYDFLPFFSSRKKLYFFPRIQDAEYLVLGFSRNPHPLSREEYLSVVEGLLTHSPYGVIDFFQNGDFILRKGHEQSRNRSLLEWLRDRKRFGVDRDWGQDTSPSGGDKPPGRESS